MKYCACMKPVSFRQGFRDIADEFVEMLKEPSADEFSDVMYGIGRLLAGIVGKSYVRMPFDRLHVFKIDERMQEHGCIRSKRHLVNNSCPSNLSQ